MNQVVETVLVVIALLVVGVLSWMISARATFARLDALAEHLWAQVEAQLRRRHALVGTLVESAREVFEPAPLAAVEDAVAQAAQASGPAAASTAEQRVNDAVLAFFQALPSHPRLRDHRDFQHVEEQLTECEDRLAAARRYYNGTVRGHNNRFDAFPYRLMKGRYTKLGYFELTDPEVRVAPALGGLFDQQSPPPAAEIG